MAKQNRLALDLMWNRLLAATDEQAATLVRAAFSPIVREAGDLSACVFLPTGEMLAQARTGTPGHINSMANAMRHFIEAYAPETLEAGDVLITNNPHQTSGQLHDFTVMTPVFHEERVVAFVGSLCHLTDVGGRGLGIEAQSQYEEGISVPIMKLFAAGRPNEELLKLLGSNVRTPNENYGDLLAQTAGNAAAGRVVLELLRDFGVPDLSEVGAHIIEESERATREAIWHLPEGRYAGRVVSDGIDEPIVLECTVEIANGGVHVDWTGSSPASQYGINVVLNYTHAYTTYAMSCLLNAQVPNNSGSLRPITVSAPEGSVLNAVFPSPVAGRHVLGHFLPMAIIQALSGLTGVQALAEGAANIWLSQFTGRSANGEPFTFAMSATGGMGARSDKDGLSTTAFPSGVMGIPTEVTETATPLIILERSLLPDSGGPGTFRGGLGQRVRITVRSPYEWTASVLLDRLEHPAAGVAGGGPGRAGDAWIEPGHRRIGKERTMLQPGEVVVLELPGGGGYGPPSERPREPLRRDLREGYVSRELMLADYGVSPEELERGDGDR